MSGRCAAGIAIACAAFTCAALAAGAAGQGPPPEREPSQASAPPEAASADEAIARWRAYSREASRRFGIPLAWIEAVMRAESGGRTHLGGRPITSRAGAMGLMQLMPGTWDAMRKEHGLGADPHDPRDNILAGTAYLARLYRRFGHPGLFGAYNAGPQRYGDWLAGRRALPGETRAYLARFGAWPPGGAPPGPDTLNPVAAAPAEFATGGGGRSAIFVLDRRGAAADEPRVPARGESLFVPLAAGDAPASASQSRE